MELLVDLLARLADLLLLPTMLLLVLGFFWTLALVGGHLAEWRRRRAVLAGYRSWLRTQVAAAPRTEAPPAPELVGLALADRPRGADAVKRLADLEIVARRALGRLMIGIRVGPVLGLAGTLIPLGPALVALSAGDTETLARKLVVAFSTSVLGLFISGCCFVMHSSRKLWYAQDLADAEFLLGTERNAG